MKTFFGLKCSVTSHSSLNKPTGIIRCPALSRVTSDDIKESMAEQGVTDVRKITVRRDGFTHLFLHLTHLTYLQLLNRLYASESRCLYTKPTSVLQLSSVWSPRK